MKLASERDISTLMPSCALQHYSQYPRLGNSLCPFTDKWIKKLCCIYTMEYYSAFKMGILPSATTWMNLEDVRLNEINQTQKDKRLHYLICMCNLKKLNT